MIRREGQSDFVDGLVIGKRGTILKTAGKIKGPGIPDGTGPMKDSPACPFFEEKQIESEEDMKNVLNKFDKSPDIPDDYIEEHHDKLEKGKDPKEVAGDFFTGLHEVKKTKKQLSIRTAKLFRQHGIFKKADKNVYQDLKTGDFWKISEDGKNVVRMFKTVDGTVEG